MKQKHNNKLISGTNISIKEFKELAFKKFKAYPLMCMNYQKNQLSLCSNRFNTQSHLKYAFCPTEAKKCY